MFNFFWACQLIKLIAIDIERPVARSTETLLDLIITRALFYTPQLVYMHTVKIESLIWNAGV